MHVPASEQMLSEGASSSYQMLTERGTAEGDFQSFDGVVELQLAEKMLIVAFFSSKRTGCFAEWQTVTLMSFLLKICGNNA